MKSGENNNKKETPLPPQNSLNHLDLHLVTPGPSRGNIRFNHQSGDGRRPHCRCSLLYDYPWIRMTSTLSRKVMSAPGTLASSRIDKSASCPSSTVPRLNSACHGRKSFGGHARSRHDAECVVPKMSEGSGMRVDLSASCEHNV